MASKKSIIDFMEENYDLNKTSNMTLEDAINSGRARAKSNSSNIKTKKKKKKNNTAEAIINGTYKPSNTTKTPSVSNTQPKGVSNSLLDLINNNIAKDIESFKPNNNKSFIANNNSIASRILGNVSTVSSNIAPFTPKTFTNKSVDTTSQKQRVAGTTTKEGYKTTGKTYGDYFYQDYKNNRELPIVEKNGKYYVYNENAPSDLLKYQDVDKMSFLSSEDEYEKAVKEGYVGSKDVRKISNQIKLDTSDLTSEERKEYTKDIKRQEKAEEKQQKHDNKVRYGGAGLKGSLGELEYLFGNAKHTTEKEIVDPVKNFGDNYETGKLNNELALEYYKKMQGKENRVDELEKEVETYNKFNQDLLTNPGATGKAIQNMNTQVESLKHQGISATILGGGGAIAGGLIGGPTGAVAGAKIGGAVGYTFGATPYTYKLEAGNQYKTLLEMGVPDDVATKYAKITGGVNAGIESGENIIDLATFGLGGKVSSKVSKEAVNEMIEEYGESTVKKWLKSKIGEESAEKVINIAKTGVKSYAQNIGSETIEEMAQESVSIGGEIGATKEAGIEREATFKDDFERVKQAGIDSAISTAFTGPLTSIGGSIVTRTMNSVGNKVDAKTLESNINKQIADYEKETGTKFTTDEKKQLLSGTIKTIKDIKSKETKTLSAEEQTLSQQQFVYEAKDTDSTYRQKLAKSTDVLNNSTAHHELFELASKVSEDTKTTYRFTNDSKEEMINEKNRFIENFAKNENISIEEARERIQDLTIDGFVNDKGEVIINADSPKALNVILGHETTHLLEGTKEYELLKQSLYKLADTKGDLNPLRDSMTKLYEGTNANIENEITSELAGEYLYTNQDFINTLASEQPNVFQRIYNYLNHLYKKVTADTKEARQLEEVIYRYKQAYNKVSKPTTQESKTNLTTEVESNTLNNVKTTEEVKISSKDNKGRTLSKEQQERFKDSKVRDEEGNLLTMYHGTRSDFNVFDLEKSGQNYEDNWSMSGKGFYFTKDYDSAYEYSEASVEGNERKVKEVYLDIKKPFYGYDNYTNELSSLKDKYKLNDNDLTTGQNLISALNRKGHDSTKVLQELGYDGIIDVFDGQIEDAVVFNSNQIKNVDNTKPTDSEDIRYSLSNNDIAPIGGDYRVYGNKALKGQELTKEVESAIAPLQEKIQELSDKIDDIAPIKSQIKKKVEIPYQVQKTPEKGIKIAKNDTINSNIEEDMIIDPTIPDLKERKWHKTALESSSVEGIINEDDLDLMKRVYEVKTNKKTLEEANSKLNTLGYDKSVDYFKSQLMNKKISTEDIALGQKLIQESLQKGDNSVAIDLIQDIAIIGTELGQQMQALSLIQRMTPTGQLRMIQKTIDRGKITNPKVYDGVEFTESMQKKILDTYNKDGVTYDQNKLNDVIENVKQDIAKQLKVTKMEKLNEWRYLAMLGNPKTHIRNLVSNVAMKATRQLKDIQARTIEDIVLRNNENRTRTWKQSSKYIKEYSKQTTEEMKELITGTKYNEQQELLAKRKIFKNELLNKVAKLNSDLLEKEDWWFSKSAFKNSYEEFLTANNIRTEQDVLENPEIIEKAKNYALEQSQIATFRQYSKFAASLNQLSKNNKVAGFVIESTMPFKKTPINVAKAGVNYSVFGLGKTITYDAYKLAKGEITASQYIDNLAQGTTGTGLMVLGYILASMGMVTGAGDEDKEAVYDSQLGGQSYSIVIGGKSYSIDWLSPVAMPFLVGAQAYEVQEKEMEITPDLFFEAVANTLDPMQEMSFMSSFNQVMRTYAYNGIQGVLEDTAQNYVLQYVPTLSSQIAATADDTKRSTAAGKDSKFRFGEETYRKFAYKIPGLRQTLEPTLDIWGNEVKQNENITRRFFDNFIAPYKEKGRTNTLIDDELLDVYNMTGRKEALPTSSPNKYVTYDKEQYNMTAKQFTEYKRTLGTTSYETLEDLFDTDAYKNASYEDKSKMIEKVFSYSKETAKSEFLDAKGVDYEVSDGTKKIKGAIDNNMGLEEYTAYKENPGKYKTIIQIDSYENYSIYKNKISEIKEKNKTTSTRKNAVMNYINTLNITPAQKLMLYKQAGGYSIKGYENYIVSYLNNTNLSIDDKRTIYNELFS